VPGEGERSGREEGYESCKWGWGRDEPTTRNERGDGEVGGRTDVLPGVAPAFLFAAFLQAWGQPEMTFVYFKKPKRGARRFRR